MGNAYMHKLFITGVMSYYQIEPLTLQNNSPLAIYNHAW